MLHKPLATKVGKALGCVSSRCFFLYCTASDYEPRQDAFADECMPQVTSQRVHVNQYRSTGESCPADPTRIQKSSLQGTTVIGYCHRSSWFTHRCIIDVEKDGKRAVKMSSSTTVCSLDSGRPGSSGVGSSSSVISDMSPTSSRVIQFHRFMETNWISWLINIRMPSLLSTCWWFWLELLQRWSHFDSSARLSHLHRFLVIQNRLFSRPTSIPAATAGLKSVWLFSASWNRKRIVIEQTASNKPRSASH